MLVDALHTFPGLNTRHSAASPLRSLQSSFGSSPCLLAIQRTRGKRSLDFKHYIVQVSWWLIHNLLLYTIALVVKSQPPHTCSTTSHLPSFLRREGRHHGEQEKQGQEKAIGKKPSCEARYSKLQSLLHEASPAVSVTVRTQQIDGD